MGLMKKRHLLGLLILLPLLLANKECQRDITWGDISKDLVAPWAADHKDIDPDTKCADCHDGRGTRSRPKSHDANWIKEHSLVYQKYGYKNQNVCVLCHQESQCVKCHQQEVPANHTQFWRMKGHGSMTAIDRNRCAVCHRGSDFCERCHAQTTPQNHTAGWGGTTDNHCYTCHEPITSAGAQGCNVCHRETPSHEKSPAMPALPFHYIGSNCKSCHTPRHPDNGTSCTSCHKL